MKYNTEREKLIIPEYGRHVQKMVAHATSIEDSKEKKKWEGGDQRGRLPAYATPQRGAAIAEAVPKHITPKPAAARGALGAACRTAVARGQAPEDEWN